MSIAKYAISKGMNREGFDALCDQLEGIADAIMELIPKLHKVDTGMFHSVNEIFHLIENDDYKQFIIVELKSRGVEFWDSYSTYRF